MLKDKNQHKALILLAGIISCFVGFINNHPLVYEDTGAYIHSGFSNSVLDDRPIFYGLFVRHISLASSLWYVIFIQAFLVCYLIYVTIGIFFEGQKKNFLFIGIITLLILTTGFSYNVSTIMPDIFTAISLLCLVNLLLNTKLGKYQKIFLCILFVFSISTQLSSVLSIGVVLFILVANYLAKKFKKKEATLNARRLWLSSGLYAFTLIFIPLTHFLIGGKFQSSGSSHVFIMNHFIETGILEDYLRNNCEKKNYRICDYKNELGWDFIWSKQSPVHKTGGWEANKKEYNAIITDIITTPKYIKLIIQKGIEYTLKQLFSFNVTFSRPLVDRTPTCVQIHWHYHNWFYEYLDSQQSNKKLNADFLNNIQQIVVLVCMVFLLVVLIFSSLLSALTNELKWTILITLLFIVANCAVSSNFSTVDERFQCRLVWLFPLLTVIVSLKYFDRYKLRGK